MQLGIFAKTFSGNDPLSVLLAVRDAGFGAAHYNMSCSGLEPLPQPIPEPVVAMLHSAVGISGATLCGLSATFNMIHPDETVRDRGFAALDRLAELAQKLAIPILTLCTGTRDSDDMWRQHRDNASVDAWRDLIDSMQRAIAIAERYHVVLGIEPETANVVNSAEKARELLQTVRSDRVKIVLDSANLIDVGNRSDFTLAFDAALDLLHEHVAMAHAKDKAADGTVVPAGMGVIDFAHVFRRLSASGFDGAVVTHGLAAASAAQAHAALVRAADQAGVLLT